MSIAIKVQITFDTARELVRRQDANPGDSVTVEGALVTRLCACHGYPVIQQLRRDRDGDVRLTTVCCVDGFDLGYGGGIDPVDYARRLARQEEREASA